jgi:site-specific recombinase XerC
MATALRSRWRRKPSPGQSASRSPDDRKSRRLSCRSVTQLKIVAGLAVEEGVASEVDPAWRLAAVFVLGRRTESTRRAYARDIRAFYIWCARVGLYPLKVHRAHVDAYLRQLEQAPQPTTGRPAAPASVARRLSTLSGLYRYAVKEGVLARCPMTKIGR